MTTRWLRNLGLLATAAMLPLSPAFAQEQDDQQDQAIEDAEEVIVTSAMRVRQGGAQNIQHLRQVAATTGMPRPEAITAEGLMGEHDLTLPVAEKCAQLFCIVTEAMPAALPLRPADRLFVGLGFASNLDASQWRRDPLDLVAVVDRSGSMTHVIGLVQASLRQIVGQMRPGDRMSIILYGDEAILHLSPTDFAGGRARIMSAIDAIEIEGSTSMEAGLKLGFKTAFADAPRFKGNTRVMLFTDEQPNVGATDAESFMGMAQAASQRGIGLTTIGVGLQFDDGLAMRISSVRGGNLFFISGPEEVVSVFSKQLDTMVSQLAHDVTITMAPAQGYRVAGVFGVPDGLMTEAPEGAVTITVPSVFLSANGGGIFATLAKSSDRADLPAAPLAPEAVLLDVRLTYNDARTGQAARDHAIVRTPSAKPSEPLRMAHLLVDQFVTTREATTAFHVRNEPKTAFALLNGLSGRIASAQIGDMAKEQKLTSDLLGYAAFQSGYSGELPKAYRHLGVIGTWEVTAANNIEGVDRGDRLQFTEDRAMNTYRRSNPGSIDESEAFEINQGQIRLVSSNTVFRYTTGGDRLSMAVEGNGAAQIALRRVN